MEVAFLTGCCVTVATSLGLSSSMSFQLQLDESASSSICNGNSAHAALHPVVASGDRLDVTCEDFEPSSHDNGPVPDKIPHKSGNRIVQRLNSPAKSNKPKCYPTEAWQQDVIALLSKIKEGLAAETLSKPDTIPPTASKDSEKTLSVHVPDEVRQEEARRLFGVLAQVDSVKRTGGKTYNYEEKYPEDAPGDELGADARIFKVYNDEAEKYDADMIRGFKDSLDGLLVFASLFSAVVTTLLVETIRVLPTDQSRVTNNLLYENNLLLRANGNITIINSLLPYDPDSVTLTTTDVWINALFVASLALSLTTALLSVLAKQWLQAYASVTSGSARDVALIRHLRFVGLKKWKMHEIIGTLPLILHTSLGLFFAGLFVFIRSLYPPLGWVVISISGVTLLVYVGTIILPTFHLECPYRLPLFYRTMETAERSSVDENSTSPHANPLASITWLRKLSSNASVKHITAWTIASKFAWSCDGIWDFLDPSTVQMFFDLVWTVDQHNTVSVRALGQLVANASNSPSYSIAAARVRDSWESKFPHDLHRAIEEQRVNYVREIIGTCGVSAETILNGKSPLLAAVQKGNLEIVKALVQEGRANANISLTSSDYGTALTAAVVGGLDIVKYLVQDGGADVNLLVTAGHFGSVLASAAHSRRLELVMFLVNEAGANVNALLTTGNYGSALVAAAAVQENLEVVKFLVQEGGADVNLLLTSGLYGSALTAAVSGDLEIVKYLVQDGGANVNLLLPAGPFGSALAAAVSMGRSDIVQFLVEDGGAQVDLLLETGSDGSALAAASSSGNIEIVKFLVAKGHANVNLLLTVGDYGSALAGAAYWGHKAVATFLVKEGGAIVDLVLQAGYYGSALASAAYWGYQDIVTVLVKEGGANVDLPLTVGPFGSALAAAANQSHLDIVSFLVEKGGADVDMLLTVGPYGSALAAAASEGHLKIIKFLVKEGRACANMLLTAGDYGSALAAAAYWGQLDVIKYLVNEEGVDTDLLLTAGPFGSALATAAFQGHIEVVTFLVMEGGADVNLQLSRDYPSALRAAKAGLPQFHCSTQTQVVKFLREMAI